MTSKGNTFKALSMRPNIRSCSSETQSYEDMPPFDVAKNIWEQLSKPPKNGIIIKENSVIDEHNFPSDHSSKEIPQPNIMSVMVTNVDTSEDRMTELEKKMNMLMKLQEMIANSINMQYGELAQTFSLYSKPHTKRIDNLRMTNGYQSPKFQ
ncbi:ty3-gypsy retrotransposon protein [Cucumis melo var. makuwa]|uniref:Ty3-gypsy retrotransposon protein n=1 Tax=Cucumis melo var. makuwa TaxID=1194695 RepID=A0A5D3BWA3_CUCMM|nr:ty3-gypsy retrotransposon protein [Cucumis melo var. makuwa]